jgi:hypothetical protein
MKDVDVAKDKQTDGDESSNESKGVPDDGQVVLIML